MQGFALLRRGLGDQHPGPLGVPLVLARGDEPIQGDVDRADQQCPRRAREQEREERFQGGGTAVPGRFPEFLGGSGHLLGRLVELVRQGGDLVALPFEVRQSGFELREGLRERADLRVQARRFLLEGLARAFAQPQGHLVDRAALDFQDAIQRFLGAG